MHIYSRNAEDMTPRYPDIVSRLPGWLAEGTSSIVLDGEAVAWDPDKSKILPFQVGTHVCLWFFNSVHTVYYDVHRKDVEANGHWPLAIGRQNLSRQHWNEQTTLEWRCRVGAGQLPVT